MTVYHSTQNLYRDPRVVSVVAVAWIVICVVVLVVDRGVYNNQYLTWNFGPSDDLKIMGVNIDSWTRWIMVIVFVAIDAIISVWVAEVVYTWLNNNVYRHEVPTQFGDRWATMIAVSLLIYTGFHAVILLFIMLSQVDILLISILIGAIATTVIVRGYLNAKHLDPQMQNH